MRDENKEPEAEGTSAEQEAQTVGKETAEAEQPTGEDTTGKDTTEEDTLENLLHHEIDWEDAGGKNGSTHWEQIKKQVNNNYYIFGGQIYFTQAETIQDSTIQGSSGGGGGKEEKDAAEPPRTPEEFARFTQRLYEEDVLFDFLAVAFLGVVEEHMLDDLAQRLRRRWNQTEPRLAEKDTPTQLRPVQELHRKACLETCECILQSQVGKVPIRCFQIADSHLKGCAAKWFWEAYPNYQETIIDWLFELTRRPTAFVAHSAYSAIETCTGFAFYAFQRIILPHFTKEPTPNSLGWLAKILRLLLPAYTEFVVNLVRGWVSEPNNPMALIGFYMLEDIPQIYCKLQQLLKNALLQHLRGERRASILLTAISSARNSPKVFSLLMHTLSDAQEIQDPKQRQGLERSMLDIAVSDYLTADRQSPRLLLMDLQEPVPRRAIVPLLLDCWKNQQSADRLLGVWNAYFHEAAREEYSLEYTRLFWRKLAFQRSPIEFNRACYCLRDLGRRYPELSGFSQSMLAELEEKRRVRRNGGC